MNISADGPVGPRTTIKFNNIPSGLFTSGERLAADAKSMRRAARLLQAAGGDEEERLAAWCLVFADQCLNAAAGMEAITALEQRHYDRDVRADYVGSVAIPNNVGD